MAAGRGAPLRCSAIVARSYEWKASPALSRSSGGSPGIVLFLHTFQNGATARLAVRRNLRGYIQQRHGPREIEVAPHTLELLDDGRSGGSTLMG